MCFAGRSAVTSSTRSSNGPVARAAGAAAAAAGSGAGTDCQQSSAAAAAGPALSRCSSSPRQRSEPASSTRGSSDRGYHRPAAATARGGVADAGPAQQPGACRPAAAAAATRAGGLPAAPAGAQLCGAAAAQWVRGGGRPGLCAHGGWVGTVRGGWASREASRTCGWVEEARGAAVEWTAAPACHSVGVRKPRRVPPCFPGTAERVSARLLEAAAGRVAAVHGAQRAADHHARCGRAQSASKHPAWAPPPLRWRAMSAQRPSRG